MWPSLSKRSFELSAAFNSSVPVKSGKLSWYPASANSSKMQMFVNERVHRSHRKIRLLCNFTTGYASIIQDQAFHALNVHRIDSVGWVPPRPRSLLTDVQPTLKRLHHSYVLLRLSVSSPYCVDIRGFNAFVHKKLHHHTLFHARTNTVVCHLD